MTAADPTGAALLRAVLAAPDDDTPRLVYADWLDEQSQGERAELIRAQVELARVPCRYSRLDTCFDRRASPDQVRRNGCRACRAAVPLARRAAELLDRVGYDVVNAPRAWPVRMTLGAPGARIGVHRGFVRWWQLTAADWLAHADELLAHHPLRVVRLTSWPDWCHRDGAVYLFCGRVPGCGRLPAAGRRCRRVTPDDAVGVATAPGRRGLTYVAGVLRAEWPDLRIVLPTSQHAYA